MMRLRRLGLWITFLIAGVAHAGNPVVASLVAEGASAASQTLVLSSGMVAINTPIAAPAWIVKPGDPVSAAQRPASLRITLYGDPSPQGREILCALDVRYFSTDGAWRPYFRLADTMLFVRQGERIVPLVASEPKVTLDMGDLVPNAQGYYPYLRFTAIAAPLAVQAWSVGSAASALPVAGSAPSP